MRCVSFIIVLLLGVVNVFAQSPHGKDLKMDCSDCHMSTNWNIVPAKIKFNHNTMTSFKLTGQHTTVSCQSCHKSLIFSEAKSNCISCHKDIHKNSLGPNCVECHNTQSWIAVNILKLHQDSRFSLVGVHQNVDCQSCHSGFADLYFPTQSTSCYSCHKTQFAAATAPNHVQANFSTDCRQCHSVTDFSWGTSNFNHNFFPLVGGHNIQNCFACHAAGSNFQGLTTACYPCHKQDYANAKNPDHVAAKFPIECQDCHTSTATSFAQASTFNHSTTGFPLTGAHTTVLCQSCHNGNYTSTPSDCNSCHNKDYAGTTNPNHAAIGLATTCQDCHNTTTFTTTTFNHSTTSFGLTGAHTTISCQSCHKGNVASTPTDCYSCHATQYNNTTDPNHAQQGFSHDCSQCHSTTSFGDANFNHSNTGFPLTGAHTTVSCQSCHNGNYTSTPSDCNSCHNKDYTATTNPNHSAIGLPTTCQDCHTTTDFTTSTFNHSTTPFPLTGAHTSVTCQSCHTGNVASTPTDCYSCHATQYNNTTDPNHAQQGFSHDCSQCHSTTSFGDANFNHSNTGFPLTGAHTTVSCQSCHNGNYTSTPSDCNSCHNKDYVATTNPNHAAIGLATTCQDCHTTTDFTTSTFNHSTTPFPLTGAHTSVTCQSCHTGNVASTPTDCYSCHATQYNNTTDPNHVQQGFSHDCSQCHSTTSFGDASFNHNNTGFPLTGAHTTVSCQSCHNGNYTSIPTTCYSCHQTDYNNTTNPAHQTAGFPTDCTPCHTTTGWTPSTFNHTTYFPLTGNHDISTCNTCHINASNFGTFSCTNTCHSQASTDPHHTGVNGYVYSPTSCYSCHPTGQGD